MLDLHPDKPSLEPSEQRDREYHELHDLYEACFKGV